MYFVLYNLALYNFNEQILLYCQGFCIFYAKKCPPLLGFFEEASNLGLMADGSTPSRITRGIPNNVQYFDDAPSFDLCISQDEQEIAGSVARMASQSSSIKRKDVVQTPSNSKASVRSTDKRRKLIDDASGCKGKKIVEDAPQKTVEVLYFFS